MYSVFIPERTCLSTPATEMCNVYITIYSLVVKNIEENRQIEKLCEERYKCAKSEFINAFDVIQCFRNFDTLLEKYR